MLAGYTEAVDDAKEAVKRAREAKNAALGRAFPQRVKRNGDVMWFGEDYDNWLEDGQRGIVQEGWK